MASKVNVKFIAIAGAVLSVGVAVLGWVAYDRISKTAEESALLGDEAAAVDDWVTARVMYSRAVAKDQSNVEWIDKWINAIRNIKPASPREYTELYFNDYLVALRGRADADRTNVESFRAFLEEMHRRMQASGDSLGAWEDHLNHVETFLAMYRGDELAGRTLRRYRGLARLGLLIKQPDPSPEEYGSARADLEAALAADPSDAETVQALSGIDLFIAQKHRRLNELTEMSEREVAARVRLEEFVKDHPPAPAIRLALLRMELSAAARDAAPGLKVFDALRARRPQIQQVVDAALAERGDRIEQGTVAGVAEVAEIALESGASTADMLFAQGLQARPGNPQLMLLWGRFELTRGNTDKALERLQALIDLPDPPVSLEGIVLQDLRGRATSLQADAMFAAWEIAPTVDGKAGFARRAKEFRDQLATYVSAENPLLLSLDARLKFIEGDLNSARRMLSDYNEQTGGDDELTLQLLAEILLRQGNTGAARTNYERVLEINPRSVRALTRLSQMAMESQDIPVAVRYLESAAIIAPTDQAIVERLRVAKDLAAGADALDPVLAIINSVRPLTTGIAPDLRGASMKVREGLLAHPGDARLSMLLAQLLMAQSDQPGAIEVVKVALLANPENESLVRLDRALNDPDPVESALKAIDQAQATDVVKHLSRHQVLRKAGRIEEAAGQIDAAAKLDPADPGVVEVQFGLAVEKADAAEMDRLCRLAEEKNIDQARGAVFRARRDLIVASKDEDKASRKAKMESIAAGLRTSLTNDRLNPLLWRMLGVVQIDLGQHTPAAESFTRAVQIRPSDAVSNKYLVSALYSSKDYAAALEAGRRAEALCGRDPEFIKLLLNLESEGPGGDRTKALETRQRVAAQSPEDLDNKLALVSLLLLAGRVDEAETFVNEIVSKDANLGVAAKAAIQAARGDRAGAVTTYRAFLESEEGGVKTAVQYIAAATFLARVAGLDEAIALLESAISKQDPVRREIDRTIGDFQFENGRNELAILAYGRLLEAGSPDPDRSVLKRIIEAHLRLGKFSEAQELIDSAGEAGRADAIMLILAAQTANGLANTDAARKAFDQAVAIEPENYVVYLKRAEFTGLDPTLGRDTEADLEQALKLKPDLTTARRMLASMYFATGRHDQGVEQIRRALAATPADGQLRMDLVQVLLAMDRASEALDLMEEAVKLFPTDMGWKLRAARVFTEASQNEPARFVRAAQLIGDIFSQNPVPDIAELYVISLTSGPSPNVTRAMEVLRMPSLGTDESWRLLMMRARVWAKAGKADEALADINTAWARIDQTSASEVNAFFLLFLGVFVEPKDQGIAMARMESRSKFTGWPLFRASLLRANIPGLEAGAESDFRRLSETPNLDPALMAAVWTTLGARAYKAREFDNALSAFQRGLTFAPDDVEINNNVAYTLGIELKRPNEAIVYAEKAAKGAPSSPMILDTLGALYLAMGRAKEASPILERSLNLSSSPGERLPALIHYASATLELGDKSRAERLAQQAQQLINTNPQFKEAYEPSLKELFQKLDGQ